MATAEQKVQFMKQQLAQKMIPKNTLDWLPTNLKKRIAAHKITINCKPENKNYNQYINSTELFKFIHKLKQENTDYDLSWNILLKENKPRPGKNTCRLCLKKALLILQADSNCINKKLELMGICRHRNTFLLMNWKEKISWVFL